MKASGISVYRALLPLAFCSPSPRRLSPFTFRRTSSPGEPRSGGVWNRINDAPAGATATKTAAGWSNKAGDRFYHYSYFDPKTSTFNQLSIFDLDLAPLDDRPAHVTPQKASPDGAIRLHFENGWVREFADGVRELRGTPVARPSSARRGDPFLREGKEPSQMTYGELRRRSEDVPGMGSTPPALRVDLTSKISFPFVALDHDPARTSVRFLDGEAGGPGRDRGRAWGSRSSIGSRSGFL